MSPQPTSITNSSDRQADLDKLRATWGHDGRNDLKVGGNVAKYLKDWRDIQAYFEEKGLPCHSFAGAETRGCITSHTYIDTDKDDDLAPCPKVVSMMGNVHPHTVLPVLPDAARISIDRFQTVSTAVDVAWISVSADAVEKHRAAGWAV